MLSSIYEGRTDGADFCFLIAALLALVVALGAMFRSPSIATLAPVFTPLAIAFVAAGLLLL